MKAVVQATRRELAAIRTGRASPALLERVVVDYHGAPVPLNQLASITAPEPRTLVVQPWDRSILKEVERAILKSDLGVTPTNDGNVVRLVLPQLTEERRRELVRLARKQAEEKRVTIRNVRRDVNEELKKWEKAKLVSEDDVHRAQQQVQQLTDRHIEEVDRILESKEKEIMEV
ncbi:MAG: ribosome recycling factor [Limnochordaceae bacterium]|nr:ribosome recycling factor [Limnochordaceae bacterium]